MGILMSISKVKTQDIPGYLYYTSITEYKAGIVVLHAFNQKPEDVEYYSKELASLGMAVIAPKYTDASDGVTTSIRALRKLKILSNINPEKVGVLGISLGGTVGLIASTQEKVGFVVDIGGWVDLASLYAYLSEFQKGTPQRYIADLVRSTLGEPDENRELYELSSPITYVDKITGSVLIIHGSSDSMVPISQSEILYRKLKELGRDVEYHVIEGGGHTLVNKEREVITIVTNFLRRKGVI